MASEDRRNMRRLQWTYAKAEEGSGEGLVVAVPPTSDVEVQEVVIATDENGVQSGDIQTSGEIYTHSEVVAMEEVQEDIPMVEIPEELLSDIKSEGRRHYQSQKRIHQFGVPYYQVMPIEQQQVDYYEDEDYYDPRYDDDGSRRSFSRRNRRPSKRREFSHRLQWRNKDMLEAMCAVEEKKLTIRGAAKKFAVPYSTLKDRIHGRVKHGTKPGVKTVLSPEEEEELVNYIRDMEAAGFQVKHMDIRDRAGELLRLNHGLQSQYRDCSPGHNWLAGFIKRHPGLEFRRQNARNGAPSIAKQKLLLRRFFEVASQAFKKGRLHNRPDRVFALADVRIQLTVHGVTFPKATVFVCAAANGAVLPPFVVFRGGGGLHPKRLSEAREAYPDALFATSHRGGSDPDIFHWWLRDFFLKRVAEGSFDAAVLYTGRPVGDITLQVSQLAKEERVSLVALPTGAEHLLQALDAETCNAFRDTFGRRVEQWEGENLGTPFTHGIFAALLQKVWRKFFAAPDELAQKFAANGLYPLNPAAISAERIVASASMAARSDDEDDDGSETPPPEMADNAGVVHHGGGGAVGSDGEGGGPLSGLNLLSALSTHEFASLKNASAGRHYTSRHQSSEVEAEPSPATQYRRGPGRRSTTRHADFVYDDEEIDEEPEAPHSRHYQQASSRGRGGYRASHDAIQRQFQQQQQYHHQQMRGEAMMQRPGGGGNSSALVERLTRTTGSIRDEIAAARRNEEQIARAIDSILDSEAVVQGSSGGEGGVSSGYAEAVTPSQQRIVLSRSQAPQIVMTPSQSAAVSVDGTTSAGGGAKTVKIIKVKVEKGTDLQELAKQLTRKIKDERDRQALTRQQQTLQSSAGGSGASNSLQVIRTIAFPGMISAEAVNANAVAGGYKVAHYAQGQGQEEEEEGMQEVVEEQVVEMDEAQQ